MAGLVTITQLRYEQNIISVDCITDATRRGVARKAQSSEFLTVH